MVILSSLHPSHFILAFPSLLFSLRVSIIALMGRWAMKVKIHFSKEIQRRRPCIVIKLDIVNRVADRTGVPKMKAEQAVDALFHSMKEALTRGERIELRGFGVFVVKPRKRGVGRNPRTGEEVAIPSGKTIRFKPGKELQAHGFDVEDDAEHDAGETENPRLPDAEF
jgi:DNA-binding protein HU-beta